MSRIAFLNDTSSWYHWGCTATSAAVKEAIAARGHEVVSVAIQALHACTQAPQTGEDFDSPEFFEKLFTENPGIAGPILNSDLVLINGEGSLHHTSRLPLTILYLAYAAKRFIGKPVQIVNHSCYPDGDRADPQSVASRLYAVIYNALDYVAIREPRSLAVVKALGIEAALSFDCLPLYLHRHPRTPSPRKQRIVVASSAAWRGEGIGALARYIGRMARQGFEVIVLSGAAANPALDDAKFVEALGAAASEGWTRLDAKSLGAWLDAIATASLLVSGRFHHTIAACMLGTPVVLLASNTPKNLALAEMAALPPPQNYGASDLETALLKRSETALGKAPIGEDKKAEWVSRAEVNFARL